jgi:ataxia telangiectasia mutated family protein
VRQLLSCRETLFSVLGSNSVVVDSLRARTGTIRNLEAEALVSSSMMSRRHGALQESLASVTYLSDMVPDCKAVGLDIEATAQHEVANVLWDQGEAEISIRMRQHLIEHADFDSQNLDLSLPVLLARLVSTDHLPHRIFADDNRHTTLPKLGLRSPMTSCASTSNHQSESSRASNKD